MRRFSSGAECSAGGVEFRVWSDAHQSVELVLEPGAHAIPMRRDAQDYWSVQVKDAGPGTRYRFRLDGQGPYPDPASRSQPDGPDGASEVIDPSAYAWSDGDFSGLELPAQVFYELHVGTFTPEGTFAATRAKLTHLRDLGVTAIELMPVGEFPGKFGWGYDGVDLYAPYHAYGRPDDLRALIDGAHAMGMGVVLDVVYNHLGPAGNYLPQFSPRYFSERRTDWGDALNFDGPSSHAVRDFVCDNAAYWVREFHFDGFRLDATQTLFDSSREHIVAELTRRARVSAGERTIVVLAENEPQQSKMLRPAADGGDGIDGMWNDDFHHSARVALTGNRDGYFHDYTGRAQELLSAIKHGFLYQGQFYPWQKKARGSPLRGLPAWSCIHFLQNHDQVGNTFLGDRLHRFCAPDRYRAMTALLLLGPQTPMLFMGQEFGSSQRFKFFADHEKAELRQLVHAGRREFLGQFNSYASAEVQAMIPDPAARASFLDSKLDWKEVAVHEETFRLHADLLRLRRQDPVISKQRAENMDGATLNEHAFLVRWFDDEHGDRLLLLNLADQVDSPGPAEPLLAPPVDCRWLAVWSSEEPRYGGTGAAESISADGRWRLGANCAVLLRSIPVDGE
jgi:maltooligosyltrehalose trehalohydrolase